MTKRSQEVSFFFFFFTSLTPIIVASPDAGEAEVPVKDERDILVDDIKPGVTPDDGWVLTFRVKLLYAIADLGPLCFSAIMGFYLNPFLLEVAGVSPDAAAIILLCAKISDAICDPFIGWASDKTHSRRFGRRKIWVAPSMIPLSALYVAIWLVPPGFSSAKAAYYVCVLVAFSFAVSAVQLPVIALGPELTSNYDERTSVMVYKVMALSGANIVATFVHSMVITLFPYSDAQMSNLANASQCSLLNATSNWTSIVNNNNITSGEASVLPNMELGYLVSAIIFASISIPPLILFLFCVPERKQGRKKKPIRRDGTVRYRQYTILESLKTMLTNRSFVCVTLIYLFSQVAIQFIQNNLFLFIKYVLNRESWFSFILLVLLGVSCVSLPFWERLSRSIGKSKVYFLGAVIGIAVFVSVFFVYFYQSQLVRDVVVWVTAVVAGISIGALFLIPTAMLPDAITQDELATGTRREGVFCAFFILFQKVALAVVVAISNLILSAAGYISPIAGCPAVGQQQPQAVLLALSLMVGIAPAVIMLLSLVALAFYPVTKEMHLETLAALEEEKRKRALITTDSEATVRSQRGAPHDEFDE